MEMSRLLKLQEKYTTDQNAIRYLTISTLQQLRSTQASSAEEKASSIFNQAVFTAIAGVTTGLFSLISAGTQAYGASLPKIERSRFKSISSALDAGSTFSSKIGDAATTGLRSYDTKTDYEKQKAEQGERSTQESQRAAEDCERTLAQAIQSIISARPKLA